MSESIIQIRDLDFAYARSLVLKHINLNIERGATVGIIGPNGGGKTTLLRLLLGLLNPTRGEISIAGLPPPQAIARGNLVGYLPQNPQSIRFPINVRQLVRLGLAGKTGLLRAHANDDLQFVESLLKLVGVADYADAPISTLSGGQLQRALIARALAPRPQILVLDEPTTGIDRAGQQLFIESIQSLQRELHLTIILVSHDLRAVASISDRIACLNVTLHYHDVPEHLPPDLVYRLFACDLEAFGLNAPGGCNDPSHRHTSSDLNHAPTES